MLSEGQFRGSNTATGSRFQASNRQSNEQFRASKLQKKESNERFGFNNSLETQLHHRDSLESQHPQPPSELSQLFSFQLPRSDFYPDDDSEENWRDQVSLLDENGLLIDRAKKNLFGSEEKV